MALAQDTKAPAGRPCGTCQGAGETTEPYYAGAGRNRHQVGEQKLLCPTCLGTCTAPE